MPKHFLSLAFILLATNILIGCDNATASSKAGGAITAEDVAWATGWQIVKVDLSDAGPFYGIGLVVADDKGTIYEESGTIGTAYDGPIDQYAPVATIAILKKDTEVKARVRLAGSSYTTSFNDVFKSNDWVRFGQPSQIGDLYYLCGESKTIGGTPGNLGVEEGSRLIALKLYRTEEDF